MAPAQSGEVRVLDVGHGNCCIIRSAGAVAIVDAAPGSVLEDSLRALGEDRVDHLLLSHADADHYAGAISLLSLPDMSCGTLWLNPDATKATELLGDLRAFAYYRHQQGDLQVATNLNVGAPPISIGEFTIRVIAPDIYLALIGPVGAEHPSGPITSNEMSSVLRVEVDNRGVMLLPGDLDDQGLWRLIEQGTDMSADVLVFPHHGGKSGGDDRAFAERVGRAVMPETVVFSMSRSHFSNPRQEIVDGLREAVSSARIGCTQLSKNCAPADPPAGVNLDHTIPSAGQARGVCCAGSMVFRLQGNSLKQDLQEILTHDRRISIIATTPMCRR